MTFRPCRCHGAGAAEHHPGDVPSAFQPVDGNGGTRAAVHGGLRTRLETVRILGNGELLGKCIYIYNICVGIEYKT